MAKSNRISRRNSRKNIQIVYSEPQKLLVEHYITQKGVKLLASGRLTAKEAEKKYGKNRYRLNPNAKQVGIIKHKIHNIKY